MIKDLGLPTNGIVLGNGPSRSNLDLHTLKEQAVIYGCNALHRDFTPDVLFANDRNMVLEILRKGYSGRCVFHEWDTVPTDTADFICFYDKHGNELLLKEEYGTKENSTDMVFLPTKEHKVFIYLSPDIKHYTWVKNSYKWGAGTGINALHYALQHGGHHTITLYGFDSVTSPGNWTNVYDGTPQYDDNGKRLECKTKGIPYSPTHGEEWINHIEELRASFPHIEVKVSRG